MKHDHDVLPMPKLTVVILCYNQEDSIERAVLSCKSGDASDVEIVIVNDGSTDSSLQEIERLVRASTQCIRLVDSAENLGTWRSSGLGFRAARSPFVTFLDGDDEFLPGAIDAISSVIECEDGRRVAWHFSLVRSNSGEDGQVTIPWAGVPVIDRLLLTYQPYGAHGGLVIAKDRAVDWASFWRPDLYNLQQDWLLHWKLADCGYRVVSLDKPIYRHRLRDTEDVKTLDSQHLRYYYRGLNRALIMESVKGPLAKLAAVAGTRRDRQHLSKSVLDSWKRGWAAGGGSGAPRFCDWPVPLPAVRLVIKLISRWRRVRAFKTVTIK